MSGCEWFLLWPGCGRKDALIIAFQESYHSFMSFQVGPWASYATQYPMVNKAEVPSSKSAHVMKETEPHKGMDKSRSCGTGLLGQ